MTEPAALPSPASFPFRCELEVRFRDLDAMGHVNNAAYLTYFEVARTGYMQRVLDSPAGRTGSGTSLFPFILAEVSCRFLAPAGLGDRLALHLRTTRIGSKSFEFEYLIVQADSGQPVAVGGSTQVYFDYGAGRTLAIPPDFQRRLEAVEGRSLSGGPPKT